MGIDLKYNGSGYYDLKEHIGHSVVVVGYGRPDDDDENVAIECEDCGCVLVDFDRPFYDIDNKGERKCCECGGEVEIDEEDGEAYCITIDCCNAKQDWGTIGEPS